MRAERAKDGLAKARADRAADGGVDEDACADDRGIADAAVHLVGEPARRRCGRHAALRVERKHRDRVVVLDVHLRLVLPLDEPRAPLPLRLGGELGRRDLDAAFARELLGAGAREEDMRRLLHDQPRKRNRVGDALDERHAARAAVVGHDGRVERDEPVAVGARAEADGHVWAVEFDHAAARLDGVERGSRASEGSERPRVGRKAVPPGRQDDRRGEGGV